MEKERGRRKRTERARKWRECAFVIRFDSECKVLRLSDGVVNDMLELDDDDDDRIRQDYKSNTPRSIRLPCEL